MLLIDTPGGRATPLTLTMRANHPLKLIFYAIWTTLEGELQAICGWAEGGWMIGRMAGATNSDTISLATRQTPPPDR